MTAILRILLIVPIGFVAACVAAGAILVLALIGGPDGWREQVHQDNDGLFVIFGGLAGLAVAGFVAVPAVIVILLAELFRWRSIFLYLAAGGLIGLSAGVLPVETVDPQMRAENAMLAAAGLVGGFVYWLVAGRSAGFTRPSGHEPGS